MTDLPPRQRSFLEILGLRAPTVAEQEHDKLAAENPAPGPVHRPMSPITLFVAVVAALLVAYAVITAVAA